MVRLYEFKTPLRRFEQRPPSNDQSNEEANSKGYEGKRRAKSPRCEHV